MAIRKSSITKRIPWAMLFLSFVMLSHVRGFQGPSGEIVRLTPPPINEAAAARAQDAARRKQQASITDQFELALKTGNQSTAAFFALHDETSDAAKKLLSSATNDYERAVKLRPGDWRGYAGLGNVYYFGHRMSDSEIAYKRAVELNPANAELHALLSRTYWDEKKDGERLRELQQAANLDRMTKIPWVHDSLAELYDTACHSFEEEPESYPEGVPTLDQCKKAVSVYQHLLAVQKPQRQPTSESEFHSWRYQNELLVRWHSSLGDDYLLLQRLDEGIAEYNKAAEIAASSNLDSTNLRCDLGEAYTVAKRYDEAVRTFATVNDPCAALGLGKLYLKKQEYDKALASFSRATTEESHNWKGFVGLGMTYYFQKQYEKSLAALEQAIQLDASVPIAHYFKGLSQLRLGRKSEAKKEYEELNTLRSGYAEKLVNEINQQ